MRLKIFSFFLFFPIFAFAQTNFNVHIFVINPSCNLSNGIIKVETNAISPTFIWENGVSYNDSIAYNLAPGNYTVIIKDINNIIETKTITLINSNRDCSVPPVPTFQIINLKEGVIRINTSYNSDFELKCEISDGNSYKNIYSNILHKFQNSGTYNVCITLTNILGSSSDCIQIVVPDWKKQIKGISIAASSLENLPILGKFKVAECGGKVYLLGNGNNSIEKIYSFDESTKLVTILPIDNISRSTGDNVYSHACYNNKLYFAGKVGVSGTELCESDGTIDGTKVKIDYVNSPNLGIEPGNFIVLNEILYFDGRDQTGGGSSEYTFKFDGSSIQKISNLSLHGIYNCKIFSNQIIHNYSSSNHRLGMFDGNNLIDLLPQNTYSKIFDELNGKMIFAWLNGFDSELWGTDGTINGTFRIKDIRPGITGAINYFNFTKHNGKIFFSANDGINGEELWVTDGSENGTYLVKDINSGAGSSILDNFTVFNNKVYFTANNYIWETDGTEIGTKRLTFNNTFALIDNGSKIFTYDNSLFYKLPNAKGYNYLELDNSFSTFQTECPDITFYGSSLKFNNGNNYLVGGSIFKPCEFNFPNISPKLSFFGENNSFTTPSNSTAKWFDQYSSSLCGPSSLDPSYSVLSYNDETLRFKIKGADGCETYTKTLNIYTYNNSSVKLENIQRCSDSQFKADIKTVGFFGSNNLFKLKFGNSSSSIPFVEIPYELIGNQISATIPPEFKNLQFFEAFVLGNEPQFQETSIARVPSFQNANSSYILGDKTISEGSNSNISILFTGSSPYSFRINGNLYNNIFENPYQFNVAPTLNSTFILSDYKNNCGIGEVKKSTVNINISQCYQNLSQTGVIEGSFKAFGNIISVGKIESNTSLFYSSESNIELNPGFQANSGAIFKAEIKNCN